jgi:hypothetical protein
MNFFVILIVAVFAVNQLPDQSKVSNKTEVAKPIVASATPEKKTIEKAVKPEPPKQVVVQKEVKPEPPKQEKIIQETAKSTSLFEKAVNFFSQYYLIGLILAAIAYVYFRTRKKITLREILNKEEFKPEPSVEPTITEEFKPEPSVEPTITEEFKPEPSAEPTTTEEVKSDSQSPESSDEEEEKK